MNTRSAICVVALVAALAFVCEAGPMRFDPCKRINAIMAQYKDTDGHSLIAAWEEKYKNSEPKTEHDRLFKDTLKKFVEFFQFDPKNGCKRENVDVMDEVFKVVAYYQLLDIRILRKYLVDAFYKKSTEYVNTCKGMIDS